MLYWGWRDAPEPAAHLQNKTICSLVAGAGGDSPGDNHPFCPSYTSAILVILHNIFQDWNTWTVLENVGCPASHPLKSHRKEAVANLGRRLRTLGKAASLDECLPTCFSYASPALFLASFQTQLNLWQIIVGRVVSRVNNMGIRYFFFWHHIVSENFESQK